MCWVVICFQIVSLTYWKTTRKTLLSLLPCCDLLSNCIFDVLKNNTEQERLANYMVVICFQIVSLTYWKTTVWCGKEEISKLWFAFKLYLWRIEKQPIVNLNRAGTVVICFQIVSLTYWKTTRGRIVLRAAWLWFAFKLYLWRIEKQHGWTKRSPWNSCDLLSNCIFDVLKNNHTAIANAIIDVVICFQIVSLTYWKTTSRPQ